MSIKRFFPDTRPTLDLNFAATKRLDPRITYTRDSAGTFVGSNGLIQSAAVNQARFEHNPLTGESLGLLVEEARTNSLWPSEPTTATLRNTAGEPGNAWAVYDGTVTSVGRNGITGLEVTIGSSLDNNGFSGGGATNWAGIGGGGIFSTSATGSLSFFIHPLTWTANIAVKRLPAGGNPTFESFTELFNGGVYTGPASYVKAIFPDGTYWLHNISWTSLSTSTSYAQFPVILTTTPGDNIKKFWAGGFQWEAGAFSTSYIPTVASTVTRAADVATVANTNSSIFPISAFTTINSPFGTAGGSSTLKLVGPTVKRTAIYNGDLSQSQINTLTNTDQFWRWRVTGPSFALPNFTTNGSVTVDWGDGVIETLTTAVHTFTDSNVYHTIGFRLNSGTFFRPTIINNATYKDRVVAIGPGPVSMAFNAYAAFYGCTALKAFDATVNVNGSTGLYAAWAFCSSLTSFPFINTSAITSFESAWDGCSGLTSFPLINTAAGTNFQYSWQSCSSLTSFPLINTAAGTIFRGAWTACSGLTSFPLINTAAGTNFQSAWATCSSLTSFPLINTAAGTNFYLTWYQCYALTSFPLINTAAGTSFYGAWAFCTSLASFPSISFAAGTDFGYAWQSCSSLTTFPAAMFNTTGTLIANAFFNAFVGCALTAASIENILVSLVTNGQSNITLTLSGGTNAGAATWTANAIAAYATLISRGWTITRNA